MNRSNFEELPQWMKELWELAPNLARQVEKHINELESKINAPAQQSVQPTPRGRSDSARSRVRKNKSVLPAKSG